MINSGALRTGAFEGLSLRPWAALCPLFLGGLPHATHFTKDAFGKESDLSSDIQPNHARRHSQRGLFALMETYLANPRPLSRQPWQVQSQPRRRAVGHLADALANRRRLVDRGYPDQPLQ